MERLDILNIMQLIVEKELRQGVSSLQKATYNDQRTLINSVFQMGEYSSGSIMLRLVVIDSLYSTNAAYSYFSFEEMAERIYALGEDFADDAHKATAANDYFYQVVLTREDPKKIFSEPYGIQKDLRDGSKQMSLLSKYAYYCLLQEKEAYPLGFPIYDRLAKEAYPVVCQIWGTKHISMPSLDTPTIDHYLTCLSQLRDEVFGDDKGLFHGYQQFDILDAYLWRLGKFEGGNLSLLFGRDDYATFIRNLGLDYDTTQTVVPSFQFNAQVQQRLLEAEAPFAQLKNEDYLHRFWAHWKAYHLAAQGKRERGIPYRAPQKSKDVSLSEINETTHFYSPLNNSTTMAVKKSATIGEYVIQQADNNSIKVFRTYDNTKGALREISEQIGFEYDNNWTTQQFGSKLIDALNKG